MPWDRHGRRCSYEEQEHERKTYWRPMARQMIREEMRNYHPGSGYAEMMRARLHRELDLMDAEDEARMARNVRLMGKRRGIIVRLVSSGMSVKRAAKKADEILRA